MFALIDCNNFYASCERVFKPQLEGKPVVILSNNDGCIIARSEEAKALGIPMAAPVFKYKQLIAANKVHLFSANFALYGDFSQRVMSIIQRFNDTCQIYSIDEAFIRVPNWPTEQLYDYAHELRDTILRATGIPVSIGIGTTKTLAKLANKLAKRDTGDARQNVFVFADMPSAYQQMEHIDIKEVWGIGWKSQAFLRSFGVETIGQLLTMPDAWIQKHLKKPGMQIVYELRGVSCSRLDDVRTDGRKGILSSRSFGQSVERLEELEEAVAYYMTRAAEKLRDQQSVCSVVHVFITTNRFHKNEPQYHKSMMSTLVEATAYTPTLIQHAHAALRQIFQPGYRYKKAGVWLSDIHPAHSVQTSMEYTPYSAGQRALMAAQDKINQRWGQNTLAVMGIGMKPVWKMHSSHRSPRYTTHWSELPVLH